MSQKFNLKTLLGYEPSEEQKIKFRDEVINLVQNRTQDGNDINGKKFTKYSKKYADKKGVSRSSVDLTLTGDMLDSYDESTGKQKNIIKVKVKSGIETKKSYNHNVGDTLPTRTYFGIVEDSEIEKIVSSIDNVKPKKKIAKTLSAIFEKEKAEKKVLTLSQLLAMAEEVEIL